MELISREEAKKQGLKFFFTGIPCKRGHVSERYVSTSGCCKMCQDLISHGWYEKNKQRYKEKKEIWRKENKEKIKEQSKEYCKRTRKKKREYDKKLYNEDPLFKLHKNLGHQMREYLKSKGLSKKGRTWEKIVGYTKQELKVHLESKFRDGMTWENSGTFWHIDHIKPKSWFKIEDYKSESDLIREVWALKNLQPLLVHENLTKNNKYEG